jgi:tetratricopeptide (TPR) repeat protein
MALGPNINLPMDREAGLKAWTALAEARRRSRWASPKERDLIDALSRRYAADPPEARGALDEAYARALAALTLKYPEDMDIRTLYAEALMNLSPWQYWSGEGAKRARPREIKAQLETVLARRPDHPGANHFYIHAIEEVEPQRALAAAQRLAALMPGAGHIVHMPAHIYVRVGRYRDAISANEHAIHADQTFLAARGPDLGVYELGYVPHNVDFLAFAASMIGRREQALAASEKMRRLVPDQMLGAPGLTFLQHHRTRHLQMKVRFGLWQEILAEPAPAQELGHARGLWNYARGRAQVAQGDLAGARASLAALQTLASDPVLSPQRLEFNTSGTVLGIAAEVLAASLAEAEGDTAAAERHFGAATALEDGMRYGEPPEWSVPVREEFGAFLLRHGKAAQAETLFREDLRRFPENPWALDGLAASLGAQGRKAEAAEVSRRFQRMWEGTQPPAWRIGAAPREGVPQATSTSR